MLTIILIALLAVVVLPVAIYFIGLSTMAAKAPPDPRYAPEKDPAEVFTWRRNLQDFLRALLILAGVVLLVVLLLES